MSDAVSGTGFAIRDTQELASLFTGYDIQHLIATGGMGAVYCALQQSLDRMVAIKILPTEFSRDPEFCAGFEAEAKAMAKLNHPNLIGVYDFGEVAGMLYIIMEYVKGETLFNLIQGGAIKTSEALRLMQGICAGVASAHEHGILHRDIKPANILLDAQLQPKIGDFGLARPVESKIEQGGQIFGTPGYTAPEVIKPPHDFDQRADIFSLGVMLHELITGKLPGDDPRPASLQVRCHPRVDAVIRKATQPDPAMRFQSVAEMAAELAKVSQPGLAATSSALRPSGGGALATGRAVGGRQAAQKQAAHSALGAQGGALGGGQKPTIMMSSSQSSNTGIWVTIGILVTIAIAVVIMSGGGPDTPRQKPKNEGLNNFLNSQLGSGEDLLGGPDEPMPTPEEKPKKQKGPEPTPEEGAEP